jgi:hypothetical protein
MMDSTPCSHCGKARTVQAPRHDEAHIAKMSQQVRQTNNPV